MPQEDRSDPKRLEFIRKVTAGVSPLTAAAEVGMINPKNAARLFLANPFIRDEIINSLQKTAVTWKLLVLRAKSVLSRNLYGKDEKGEAIAGLRPSDQNTAARIVLEVIPKMGMPPEMMAEEADEKLSNEELADKVNKNAIPTMPMKVAKPS